MNKLGLHMYKIIFLITFLLVSGCSSNPVKEKIPLNHIPVQINDAITMWLQEEHHKSNNNNKDVSIYVKHRFINLRKSNGEKRKFKKIKKEQRLADYFIIINKNKENGLNLLDDNLKDIKILSAKSEMVSGVKFSTKTVLFNTVKSEKGGIYDIINEGNYSAPTCGISKEYNTQELDIVIYVVDAVSCGQLNLERKHKKYQQAYLNRLNVFYGYTYKLFGFISK